MRTTSWDVESLLGNSRAIGGQFIFRDNRLVFSARNNSESIGVYSVYDVDACQDGSGILRVATKNDGTLQYVYIDDPVEIITDTWQPWGAWSQINALSGNSNCNIAVEDSRAWFAKDDGYLYYIDYDSGTDTWGTEVQVLDISTWLTLDVRLAPVNTDLCYVKVGPDGGVQKYSAIYAVSSTGSIQSTFHGRVYGDATADARFDAVTLGDYDYIFAADKDTGRSLYTKVSNGVWSELKQVVPLDVVDNTAFFQLGSVSVIDGKIWIAGRYSRGEFMEFEMYSFGNGDNFSSARDMYISNHWSDTIGGKLFLIGNYLVYSGYGGEAYSPATMLVGVDNSTRKKTTSEVFGASINFRTSNAGKFSGEISNSLRDDPIIREGGEVEIFSTINGNSSTLGKFGLDVISPSDTLSGGRFALGGRSIGAKKMDQWESDQSYDFWSQNKGYCNPSELEEIVLSPGDWNSDDSVLSMEDLNIDGFAYTVERATRGGSSKARFKYTTDSGYSPSFGVGVNYYQETKYEAATRLGVEASEVTEGQYGNSGIFAIYDGTDMKVYSIVTDVWTEIATSSLELDADTWYWIEILFQDGYIRVSYREDATTSWVEVIETVFEEDDTEPWFRDQDDVGRGALYMRNGSVYSDTVGFSSSAAIIPVDDVTDFPTTETVIVDNEKITYDGVATASPLPDEMEWIEGYTFRQAPHNNASWDNILLYNQPWRDETGEINLGRSYTESMFVGQAFRGPYGRERVDKLYVPVKKVGSPGDLYAYFVLDAFDNDYHPVASAVLGRSTGVAAADIDTEYDWIEFDFTGESWTHNDYPNRTLAASGYGKAYWVFLSTAPSIGSSSETYSAYADASNYYQVKLNASYSEALGLTLYWKDGSPHWNNCSGSLPFQLVGAGPFVADAYEIYVADADAVTIDEDTYNDMALVCIEGPGEGRAMRIVGYDSQAPSQWVPNRSYLPPDNWEDHVNDTNHGAWEDPDARRIFVDERPSSFGDGSKFLIKPALMIGTDVDGELLRGVDDTTVTSHGETEVSIYRSNRVLCDSFEVHSTDIDMRIEDMAAEIAGKSGVFNFTAEKDIDESVEFTDAGWNGEYFDQHRHAIVKFDMPTLAAGGEVGLEFRLDDPTTPAQGYRITIDDDDNVNFYIYDSGWTLLEEYPMSFSPGGEVTISVQTDLEYDMGHFSIWVNGRFVHSFTDGTYLDGDYIGIVSYLAATFVVDISAPLIDRRVDNFILDMGVRGYQLLTQVIGAKRIGIIDKDDGGIHLARIAFGGSYDYTIPDIVVDVGRSISDAELKTVIRSEGGEIVELVDYDQIAEHGFLFGMFNAPEATDEWETSMEATAILYDVQSSAETVSFVGAADPRIESNDVARVYIPSGYETIIIDAVDYTLDVSGDQPIFDMSVEARYAIN